MIVIFFSFPSSVMLTITYEHISKTTHDTAGSGNSRRCLTKVSVSPCRQAGTRGCACWTLPPAGSRVTAVRRSCRSTCARATCVSATRFCASPATSYARSASASSAPRRRRAGAGRLRRSARRPSEDRLCCRDPGPGPDQRCADPGHRRASAGARVVFTFLS